MKYYFIPSFLLIICVSVNVSNSAGKKALIQDDLGWVKYTLDNHWTFSAPKGTKILYLKGLDSVPGNIIIKSDSIKLEFDSGFNGFFDASCSIDNALANARSEIMRGAYKYLDKPDTLHIARVDTINGMVATFITPVKTGAGTISVDVSDCKSHSGLGIFGKNISAAKQELVSRLFRSIRYDTVESR